ncbi:hypothetical protein G9A89_010685 [Geosiphon pyriformis]|nr:hypothetical protein G9A89_010685 [Geosiphon pyriformis]
MSFTRQTRPSARTQQNQQRGEGQQDQKKTPQIPYAKIQHQASTNREAQKNRGQGLKNIANNDKTRKAGNKHSKITASSDTYGGQRLGGGSLLQESFGSGLNPLVLAAERRMQKIENPESQKKLECLIDRKN